MPFSSTLSDITSKLRQGRFPNEQAISQGIVLRILHELGWDVYDTNIVWPEFQTGEGRADFALCYPASKPAVFIEVKQPGGAEDGIRQALEYAFHTGVPFIVLTDGKTWSFYLPAEQGSYEDRRVYKLDLFEQEAERAVSILKKYLAREKIESGEALDTARREYRSRNRRSVARQAIPDAWRELINKGDELLVELVANAVESKAGVRPEDDDITSFLENLGAPRQVSISPQSDKKKGGAFVHDQPSTIQTTQKKQSPPRNGTLVIKGKSYAYANAKEAMAITLRILADGDPSFLQRCSQHPDCYGKKRRYIAKEASELYPNRPDLEPYHEVLPDGWLVSTNLNNNIKRAIIKAAAQVAGLTFGSDIMVDI